MLDITQKGSAYLLVLLHDPEFRSPGLPSKSKYVDAKLLAVLTESGPTESETELLENYEAFVDDYKINEEERRAARRGLARLFEAGMIDQY